MGVGIGMILVLMKGLMLVVWLLLRANSGPKWQAGSTGNWPR